MTTPTTSARSATGRQLEKSQKSIACPKAGPNRRLHRSAAPRRAEGHCTGARQRFSLWTVHGPFLFWHDKREMGGCIRPAISMAESPSHRDGHIIRNKRGNINGQTIWNRRHPRRGGGEPHCRHGLPRGAGRGHCSDGGQGQPPHRGDRQGHPHLLRHAGVRPDGGASAPWAAT